MAEEWEEKVSKNLIRTRQKHHVHRWPLMKNGKRSIFRASGRILPSVENLPVGNLPV